jgi:hypothetical protein
VNQRFRTYFTLGLVLTGGLTKLCQGATGHSLKAKLTITIRVYNYAEVSPKTLTQAEKIAAGILWKAGVTTRWLDRHQNSEEKQQDSSDSGPFHSSEIVLHVLSRSMTERFGLTSERLGFTPGQGPDRWDVYAFYDQAEELARQQREVKIKEATGGTIGRHADITQILGHVVAHELGHLLGLESHTPTGIVRADWNLADLQDAACGYLLFTPEQAEVIRTDVGRRTRQQKAVHQDANGPQGRPRARTVRNTESIYTCRARDLTTLRVQHCGRMS